MKSLAIIAALLRAVIPASAQASEAPIDLVRLRECWRAIEGWERPKVGKDGELGPFQIKPSVWLKESNKPLSWAYGSSDLARAEQDRVALAIVTWCAAQVMPLHLPPGIPSIALVWRVGFGNIQRRPITKEEHGYSERVENLYRDPQFK